MDFTTGDLVMLKSGGPTMTVRDAKRLKDSDIRCDWFDAHDGYQTAWFGSGTLVHQKQQNEDY